MFESKISDIQRSLQICLSTCVFHNSIQNIIKVKIIPHSSNSNSHGQKEQIFDEPKAWHLPRTVEELVFYSVGAYFFFMYFSHQYSIYQCLKIYRNKIYLRNFAQLCK